MDGYSGVSRWTRKVQKAELYLTSTYPLYATGGYLPSRPNTIPIHLGAHWAVVFVDPKKDLIEYYDSMLCDGQTSLSRIRFAMILKILPYNY